MKRKYFNGKARLITTIRIGCAAAVCMLPAYTMAGTSEPAPAPAEPEAAANWVDFTIGGAFTGGNEAAYQRRLRNDDFYGGISDLHWETEANDITWTVDGHALFGTEDYEIMLGAEKADLGYIEAGFRQFRTWYNGSGGYVPGNDIWYQFQDDALSLDRGEVWFEAGLRKEDFPELTFRYTHAWRDGDKDSTMWSRGVGNANTSYYGIVPGFYMIDETRDVFELDVEYTVGNTDLGLGLSYEMIDNQDTRKMPSLNGTEPLIVTQRDEYESDLFNAHIFSESRLNDQMLLSFAYAFTTVDTDTDGSTRYQNIGIGRHDFTPIAGGAKLNSHVANANFWWNPVEDLVIVPSFRAEWNDQSAVAYDFNEPGEDLEDVRDSNDFDFESYTEQIEVRYNGIENILLYARAEMNQTDGDMTYRFSEYNTDDEEWESGRRLRDSDIDEWKTSVGANWYPLAGVRVSTEYYHQDFDQNFDNELDGYDAHIDSHDIETDDFNVSVSWRAMPNLTLVTRYDYQESTYDTKGLGGAAADIVLPVIESAEVTRHVLSQSATWRPFENGYIQGSVGWISEETDTPADEQAPLRITDCDNDYIMANLIVGYSIDSKTEITASYSYYYSQNYASLADDPNLTAGPVPGSVGFGTDLEEHVFSVSLNRWINPNMIWNIGYGYYNSNDGTSGGNNDFDAHMVSTGLQIRF